MKRSARWIVVAIFVATGLGFGAVGASAGPGTPLWGWDDHGFSLWPAIYIGQGGLSLPGLRLTDHSFSIPLIHYGSEPKTRFDLTPVYHYREDQAGFALGPARGEINEGEQGIANLTFDLLTLITNTRPYLSDDHVGYETYREYGRSDMVIPGAGDDSEGTVTLAQKVEEIAPPVEETASEPETETARSPEAAPEQAAAPAETK